MKQTSYEGGNQAPEQRGAESHDPHRRQETSAFIAKAAAQIPGWLNPFTAICAAELLDAQEDNGLHGSLLEIGVFGGRFFSMLARNAARTGSRLLGIDPFLHFSKDQVRHHLAGVKVECASTTDTRVNLLRDYSGNWTADGLLSALEDRARFVHIDGSHDRENVLWDLDLADKILAPHGIIAIDDFLNPQCLGVNEATHQFFQHQPRRSVPLAFAPGKLFLAGRLFATLFKQRLTDFAMQDQEFPQSARFRTRTKVAISGARQTLFGTEILSFF